MPSNSGAPSLRASLLRAATFTAAAIGLAVGTAQALVTPDAPPGSPPGTDPVANAVDTGNTRPYWVGLAIRNEAGNSGGTCTGLLINPRTVLFAAHCVDGLAPRGLPTLRPTIPPRDTKASSWRQWKAYFPSSPICIAPKRRAGRR